MRAMTSPSSTCAPPHTCAGPEDGHGSLLDEDLVNTVVSGADAVFDFAGLADIGNQPEARGNRPHQRPRQRHPARSLPQGRVKRYVFASTLYVYGKSGSFYRCSKQACELAYRNYHDMFGLECTILRWFALRPRADRRNAINRFVAEALERARSPITARPRPCASTSTSRTPPSARWRSSARNTPTRTSCSPATSPCRWATCSA
ncbi:MAG: NAD-dependent epimerase/dehydratase family protein [Bilophila wadsworthia]